MSFVSYSYVYLQLILFKTLSTMKKERNAVNTLILTSLLVLGAGCATSQYRNEPTITLQANEKSIEDTTFLYAPHTVCLETNDEALIARVDKVIEWNQTLYILDKRKKTNSRF